MTKPCGNCNHKADIHVRGQIITTDGRILRPYSGRCKIESCLCQAFLKQPMITKELAQEIIQLSKVKWNKKLPIDTRALASEKLNPILAELRVKFSPNKIKTVKSNGVVVLMEKSVKQ